MEKELLWILERVKQKDMDTKAAQRQILVLCGKLKNSDLKR